MEKIWEHTFNYELRIDPAEHSMLLTEPAFNPMPQREKTMEIMFERFNAPAFYLAVQQVLSLLFSGKKNGIVVDSGYGVSHCVPIYEGSYLLHSVRRLDMGGKEVSEYLQNNILGVRGFNVKNSDIEEIKCKFGFISKDLENEKTEIENTYTLPDGNTITLNNQEIAAASEVLFQPHFLGKSRPGLHMDVFESIRSCDPNLRTDMYQNIVLSGGNTMLRGFADKIKDELVELAPLNTGIRVSDDPARKYSSYFGGTILSKLASFQNKCITKEAYDENGKSIIHRMCF